MRKSILSIVLCMLAVNANASLITNGSFESYSVPHSDWAIPSYDLVEIGSNDIVGWKVINGQIDYVWDLWQASDGSKSLDLSGNYSRGGIQQTIATTIGGEYTLSFDMSGNPHFIANEERNKLMSVMINGSLVSEYSYNVNYMGNTLDNMLWQNYTLSFVATTQSTDISFFNSMINKGATGPVLDNVSVISAVPIPAAAWLFGSGLIGLIGFTRRKAHV